jgi:tetratricopeptide (TPR) repeat protein
LQIAKIYSDSAYDKSLAYYNKALNIAEQSRDRKKIAHVYHQIGYMYLRKGEFPTALTNFNNALEIHEYLNNKKGIGQLLNDIGLIYRTWGKYDKALENYIKALSLFDEIGDIGNAAMASNNIGQIYYYRSEYDKSIEYFKKYLAVNKTNKSPRAVAGAANNIASAFMELKRYDDALEYYIQSMRIYDSLNIKLGVGIIKDNIGSLFLRKNQYNDALLYHTNALKIFEEAGSQSRVCVCLQNIGLVHTKLNNPELAINYLNRSLAIALRLKQKETQKDVYESLSDIYQKTNNFEKAYLNYKRYVQINDSLLNAETIGKIETVQAEYEAQKKEKELAEINHRLHNQKIIIILSAGVFLLFVFLAILIVRENLQKKKTIAHSLEKTQSLYSLLNKTGNKLIALQNEQNPLSNIFDKSWFLFPRQDQQYPHITFLKDQFLFFSLVTHDGLCLNPDLISLSVLDFYHSINQFNKNSNIKELYNYFISKESKWSEVLDDRDRFNIDFCAYNKELKQLQYFGSNNAYVVNSENQITSLPNNISKLVVNKGDRFYILTSNYVNAFNPEQELLQETLSKTIIKTVDIPFVEQQDVFRNSLELIKAGNEYQNDISIFAFLI